MRLLAVLAAVILMVVPAHAEDAADPLAAARQMYNDRRFDEAIAAAESVRELPGLSDSADLVAARAYLERHRQTADEQDLVNAHERLRRINPERFDDRERTEYAVGLGATLYFEGLPGAAAAAFWSLLEANHGLEGEGRDRLLDWWASATDRDARPRAEPERRRLYETVHDRMRLELSANPSSPVAAYWIAAAAAGQADWQRAWDEAQAAWVRAPLMSDRGAMLRPDLDRLVRRAVAPERAKATGRTPEELVAEWDAFTEKWSR